MKENINKKRLIIIAISIVVVISLIKSINLMISYASLNKELDTKTEQLEELKEENRGLENLLLPENESTLMEEYAHKMGYAYPDERLYIYE